MNESTEEPLVMADEGDDPPIKPCVRVDPTLLADAYEVPLGSPDDDGAA